MFERQPLLDSVVSFVADNTRVSAIAVSTTVAWVVYGLLGKRYLGADDDFVEAIRAALIPVLQGYVSDRPSLFVESPSTPREYAGYTRHSTDEVERRLVEAGFLRQPLASLHVDPDGREEVGSWSRPRGPLLPVEAIARRLPATGGVLGRFVKSLDVILARRQTHVVLFVESRDDAPDLVHLFAHDEPNPVNPLTAYAHYRARGFRPAPDMARRELADADLRLNTDYTFETDE